MATKRKKMAYQTSRGAVSDFIQRYLQANPENSWEELKTELKLRFSENSDAQHALCILRETKQKVSESVQCYAERLLSLAELTYEGQPIGFQAIERQLIGIFIDGLIHDYLQFKVMRDDPQTLQAVVNSAVAEQNLRKKLFCVRNANIRV